MVYGSSTRQPLEHGRVDPWQDGPHAVVARRGNNHAPYVPTVVVVGSRGHPLLALTDGVNGVASILNIALLQQEEAQ